LQTFWNWNFASTINMFSHMGCVDVSMTIFPLSVIRTILFKI
jgi:hypothetical protein